MNKKFSELAVGERFKLNGSEYVKTQETKISCCRAINAQLVSDGSSQTWINPITMVTTNA
jgi:hypothetical protein